MFAYHDIFLSENGPPTATAKHIKLLIYNIFIHSVSANKYLRLTNERSYEETNVDAANVLRRTLQLADLTTPLQSPSSKPRRPSYFRNFQQHSPTRH